MKKIIVGLKENPYPVIIERGLRNNILPFLKKFPLGNLGFVITSPRVFGLHKKIIKKNFKSKKFKIIITADGEKAKTKYWLFKIIGKILELDSAACRPFVLCLGGGTVGDLGGLAASIYKRGIPCVQIPTTLVGQIDSGIGGKTAIDLPRAKNITGTFWQPKAVLIDPGFLDTLTKKCFREGISEAIKYGIIKDKKLFYLIKNNSKKITARTPYLVDKIIYASVKIKAEIVSQDEKEAKGVRTMLNFGHTFAHGLEAAAKYKKISHGKAVALGMLYAAHLSQGLKLARPETVGEIKDALRLFGLPGKVSFCPSQVLKAIAYDKKFTAGKIRMVLVEKIGKVRVWDKISFKDLEKTLEKILKINLN